MSEQALSDEDDLLAAELAFGLIDGADRRDAEIRLGRESAFVDAHARWQRWAVAMAFETGEAPSASVWRAIEARLPANSVERSHKTLRWWQAATLATSAVAAMLAAIVVQKPLQTTEPVARAPASPLVAVLTGRTGVVTVSFDPETGRIVSAANGLDIGKHAAELWVIPADGKPRPIGVMKTHAPEWMKVPAAAASALTVNVTIAVSAEPIGGSPTGQPTGPIILTGKMRPT